MKDKATTKSGGNRYYDARIEAGKWHEKLLTRAGAIEHLPGVTEDSLKRYELGITKPPNDVVALMADAYNAPELILWYCAHECPLGGHCREVPEMPPERTFVRLTNTMNNLGDAMRELAQIMDDGAEQQGTERLAHLRDEFLEARRRIDETLTVLEKLQKRHSAE